MNLIKKSALFAAFCAGLLASSFAGAEPDPKALAERLVELWATDDSEASYKTAAYSAGSDTVTIVGFQIKEKGGDGVANIGSIAIRGYDEANMAGLTAQSLTFAGIEITDSGFVTTIASANIMNLSIPTFDIDWNNPSSWGITEGGIAISSISITDPKTGQPIKVAGFTSKTYYTDGTLWDSTRMSLTGLTIPTVVMEPEMQAFMQASGYQDLMLNISLDARYDMAQKNLDLRSLSINAKDMGQLDMWVNLGSIPQEVVKGQLDDAAMEELGQTMTIRGASIKFTNASIFEKGLAFAAAAQGQDPEALKQQISPLAQLLLAQINNKSFSEEVTSALTSFTSEPKSLSIQMTPREPVTIPEIIGNAQENMQQLPDLLRIEVKANR